MLGAEVAAEVGDVVGMEREEEEEEADEEGDGMRSTAKGSGQANQKRRWSADIPMGRGASNCRQGKKKEKKKEKGKKKGKESTTAVRIRSKKKTTKEHIST